MHIEKGPKPTDQSSELLTTEMPLKSSIDDSNKPAPRDLKAKEEIVKKRDRLEISKIRDMLGIEQATKQVGLKDIYSQEQLDQLRLKTKKDYAGSLVNNKNENLFQALSTRETELNPEETHLLGLTKWRRVNELQKLTKKREKLLKKKRLSKGEQQELQDIESRLAATKDWLSENENKYEKSISYADAMLLDQKSQEYACRLLDEKIASGVVKPDSIYSDMLSHLKLRDKHEIAIKHLGQIAEQISQELDELTEKRALTTEEELTEGVELIKEGFIMERERRLIQAEAEKFAMIYQEAFPEADLQQIFTITRDNARKLAYQTERDKRVFSGSDHGTRHIIKGNMAMADRIIASLGDQVSAKDKALIHQIIIDHDLGYTVGVAQAEKSFAASKDHPLFSTKFVEANQDYYLQMFGEDGYKMIRDGILMHSYPHSEYETPTDPKKGFNPDIIRSITSTVDALGVTAEIKCPAFFRQPKVIEVLQKVKFYADTHGNEVPPEQLEKYKEELRIIARQESNKKRQKGALNAIDQHFNLFTAETTLGQYVGVLSDIEIKVPKEKNKKIPHIKMDISRVQALLGDLFGDEIAIQAFTKAMDDFGVSKHVMAEMAKTIKRINEIKQKGTETDEEKRILMTEQKDLEKKLTYTGDKAVFEFAPLFAETTPEIQKVFERLEQISIRDEITNLMHQLESPTARTPENIEILLEQFGRDISEEIEESDMTGIMAIQEKIRNSIDDPGALQEALQELNNFIIKKEKKFMNIE